MTMASNAFVSQGKPLRQAVYFSESGLDTGNDQIPEDDISLLCKQVMHDVRGDLVSLAIMAKLLQRGSYGSLPANICKQMGELEKRANSAAGLLENYCRLAVVAGKGTLCFDERLDCRRDVINPVEQELTMELANREVSLIFRTTPGGYLVNGNKLLLQSVFRTLFHNAIRHSNRKGTITCGLEADGKHIRIFIANNGAVVPEHLRHRMFKQFTKAESDRSVSAAGGGLGLGLFLGRNIINRHGGDIWYEPMPAGSKFVLTLPAASQ
jgi:signal transduction histidine kinase